MPPTASDQPLNLKHRLTGAVILIGAAVAAVSLLLDPGDAGKSAQPASAPEESTFVSRIVGAESGETRAPSPASAPVEPLVAESAPSQVLPDESKPDASEVARVAVPEAVAPPPALDMNPVLEPATSLPKPVPRINTVKADGPAEEPAVASVPTRPAQREAPKADESWIVRVGAFSDKANADGISRRLREGGYAPSSESITVNGKAMVRVWVGPYPDRKSAVRAKSEISKGYDLNGFVDRER